MTQGPAIPLDLLRSFLQEDAPAGDLTSDSLLGCEHCRGRIVAREGGIVAGLEEATCLFAACGVKVAPVLRDGDEVARETTLADLEGPARAVLLVERTALNIIGRMSGIATMTRRIQDLLDRVRPGCRVAATRKTAPGLRLLDKKAVILGGGDPHRITLSDGFLIKDNHLALLPIEVAVARARAQTRYRKVEVEVQNPDEATRAAGAGADILLLDNMPPGLIRETLSRLDAAGLRDNILIEVSGGIREENILDYALEGVDLISIGALTHSPKNLDVSLEIFPD